MAPPTAPILLFFFFPGAQNLRPPRPGQTVFSWRALYSFDFAGRAWRYYTDATAMTRSGTTACHRGSSRSADVRWFVALIALFLPSLCSS